MGLIGFTTHLNTKVTEQLGEGVLREPVMVVLLIRRRVVPHIFFFCAVGSTRKRTHPRVVLVVTDSLLAVNLCQPLCLCVCVCVCDSGAGGASAALRHPSWTVSSDILTPHHQATGS